MNILIEGVDACGKSTQIQFIQNEFERMNRATHVIHYSNLKFSNDSSEIKIASMIRYRDMFDLMSDNDKDESRILIFDRSHVGECVYSPLYRNYSGDYVFEFEKNFKNKCHPKTKLICFLDDAEKIIQRDIARGDSQSFSLDIEKKKEEIALFENAVNSSCLDKKIIYLKGRTPQQIFEEDVWPFITEKEMWN